MCTCDISSHAKECLEMARSCHLFATVPIQSSAVQYHVDLAQNCLQVGWFVGILGSFSRLVIGMDRLGWEVSWIWYVWLVVSKILCYSFQIQKVMYSVTSYWQNWKIIQNPFQMSMRSSDHTNEFYAQLIRLTSSRLPTRVQCWKLLALATSLRLPTQYAVMSLLKRHLQRANDVKRLVLELGFYRLINFGKLFEYTDFSSPYFFYWNVNKVWIIWISWD